MRRSDLGRELVTPMTTRVVVAGPTEDLGKSRWCTRPHGRKDDFS